jgi:hypothetical protein
MVLENVQQITSVNLAYLWYSSLPDDDFALRLMRWIEEWVEVFEGLREISACFELRIGDGQDYDLESFIRAAQEIGDEDLKELERKKSGTWKAPRLGITGRLVVGR